MALNQDINPRCIELFNKGNYFEAGCCFEDELILNPNNEILWNYKGICLGQQKKNEQAIECFDRAIKINLTFKAAWQNKGNSLAALERYEESITCFERSLEIDPNSFQLLNLIGNSFLELACYDDAIQFYDKSLTINPKNAPTWNDKGCVLIEMDQFREAIKCFKKGIKFDAKFPPLWNNLGTCYGKLGDYKEAINCYDKTLELNPNYQNAKNNREKAMRKLRGEEITIQGIPLKDIVTSTLIEFNLPFSLSIPDGIYSLKYLGKMYKIHTRKIFRKESIGGLYGGWTIQGSGKVELKYDKWGWFSYSNIRVEFEGYIENAPGLKSKIFDESPRQSLKELSLKIINRFIDVYRTYTKKFFTDPISYSDIFEYQIYYRINNRLKKGPFHSITTSGAMTLSSGISEYPMNFQGFKENLVNEQELSLPDIYLLNAKDALFKEDARRATLEGVIALELVLSEFLLKRGIEKGIGGAELKNVLIDIGLTGNLKVSLKLVLKDGEIINDDLISKCKSAITVRNKIVHEGLREISFDETEERILTIEEFINRLKSFS